MAEAEQQLVVQLEARIRDFERNFQKASRVANDNWRGIENRGRTAARNLESTFLSTSNVANAALERMGAGIGSLKGQIGGLASALTGALSINQLRRYVDAWQELRNRIAAAGEAPERVGERASSITDIAIRSRSDVAATGDLYSGLTRSTKELGANQAQVLQATETISKAFMAGGQSAQTAAGAIQQLNQAMSAGKLSGDELNSVLEGAPALARLIAAEFGVSVGQLKKLAEEGKLTSDKVFGAILKGAATIEAEFARTNPTIAQSFNVLSASVQRFWGQLDEATGTSAAISRQILKLGENIDVVMRVAAVAGTALLAMAAPAIARGLYATAAAAGAVSVALSANPIGATVAAISAAVTAVALFGDQVRPITGDLATLADYGSVAFSYIKDAGGQAASLLSAGFAQASQLIAAAMSGVGGSVEGLLSGIKTAVNAIIGSFVAAKDMIVAAWNGVGPAIAEGVIGGLNAVITATERTVNRVIQSINRLIDGVNGIGANVGVSLNRLGEVELGRITNTYAGAGRAAGEAFGNAANAAMGRDYLGNALSSAEGALRRIREQANKTAAEREAAAAKAREEAEARRRSDGTLNNALRRPTGFSDDEGGGGRARRESNFDREIKSLEAAIRQQEMERASIGKTTFEVEKAQMAHKLLEAAERDGTTVTEELRNRIDQLATSYATVKVATDQAREAEKGRQDAMRFFGSSVTSVFSDILAGGKSAERAIESLKKRLIDAAFQAALLGDGPLAKLFGMSASGGAVGGIFGAFGKLLGFSEGGYTGNGGKYEPAGIVHRGEYVMPQEVVARIGVKNLEAIRRGVPGYASGGSVGAIPVPAIPSPPTRGFAGASSGGATVNVSAPVTINANGGTPQQNQDLAERTSREMVNGIRAIVGEELRKALRPNGLFEANWRK